ncbi:uncharacterized protein LOC132631007 [Lycium barbarum]|uniref:uncharacterized protein LOC132631007 n=1 Tax=Lycium barbarum TaxID=112863 RepID=UPI00293E3265|nr:uncharacterized protein LOC132631007 [Lycium barbarum]
MTSHQFESFNVRFTEKNYSAWEFQFQLFVIGKELWCHIDGSDSAPTDPTKLNQWKVKDAQLLGRHIAANFFLHRWFFISKDQVSAMIIAKGPKVGRLLHICFSIPRVLSFACTSTASKTEVWHKRLGHPNSIVLSHLSNSDLLEIKINFQLLPLIVLLVN